MELFLVHGTELIMAAEGPDFLGGPSGGRAVGYLLGEGWGPTAPDAHLIFQDLRGQVLELALQRGAQGCTMNS